MARVAAAADRQDGVVSIWQCRRLGMELPDIKRLCRSGRWLRLFRGAYLVDADVAGPPSNRASIRAAMLSAGPHAVAVLDTAAAIHGISGLRRPDGSVHVSFRTEYARPRRLVDRRLLPHQLAVPADQVTLVNGLRVTNPLRTIADLSLRLDRYTAVSVMDSALNRGLVTPAEFATLPSLIRGRHGAGRVRMWLAEADARAESPLETRVRLCCVDGRVAPDVLQHRVYNGQGFLLGVGDLAWLSARVLAEADGAEVHDRPEAVFRDRRRQNELANEGWHILRFTWEDTRRRSYIPHTVRQALARPLARP